MNNDIKVVVTKSGLVFANTQESPQRLDWDELEMFAEDIGQDVSARGHIIGGDNKNVTVQIPKTNTALYYFPKERVIIVSL
jgi:hypothetical protein